MPKLLRLTTLLFFVSGLVGCDHVTKHVAKSELEGQSGVTLVSGLFKLVYTENYDIGFNLLRWMPDPPRGPLLLATGILTSLILLAMLLWRRGESRWQVFALALLLAGGVGNTLDRVLRGYVIDFLHLRHWPVFNLADVYVVAGMIALLAFGRPRAGVESPS